jgi:hypothetical protein
MSMIIIENKLIVRVPRLPARERKGLHLGLNRNNSREMGVIPNFSCTSQLAMAV